MPKTNRQQSSVFSPRRVDEPSFRLNESEQNALLRIAASAQEVTSVPAFKDWVISMVAQFFPHQMLLGAAGSVCGVDVRIERLIGVGYPDKFLSELGTMTDLLTRPVLRRWLAENKPQIIDQSMVEKLLSPLEQKEVHTFGLVNIAAYGVLDLSSGRGTYFSFSRVPGPLTRRHGKLLEMVVPYLHHALLRTTGEVQSQHTAVDSHFALLTPKEHKILALIGTGLTNREISDKLGRSELTVQTHVHSLLKKLNVPSRTAAVAMLRGAGRYNK